MKTWEEKQVLVFELKPFPPSFLPPQCGNDSSPECSGQKHSAPSFSISKPKSFFVYSSKEQDFSIFHCVSSCLMVRLNPRWVCLRDGGFPLSSYSHFWGDGSLLGNEIRILLATILAYEVMVPLKDSKPWSFQIADHSTPWLPLNVQILEQGFIEREPCHFPHSQLQSHGWDFLCRGC